jgi:hypothetical protein
MAPPLRSLLAGALLLATTLAFDVVGWYVGTNTTQFPLSSIRWDIYTTVVLPAGPSVSPAGVASCVPDDFHNAMLAQAQLHGRTLTWGGAVDVASLLFNASFAQYRVNYLASLGAAVRACNVTSIEFDYECPPTPDGSAGIVTPAQADAYTDFLVSVIAVLDAAGVENATVSGDVGVWGLDGAIGKGSSYPLELSPWVNATKLALHPRIFVNTMSYHTPDSCSILPWQLDGLIMSEVWGIPKAQINLGIGFYSFGPGGSEPIWLSLSQQCPGLAPSDCHCNGISFASKAQCFSIGAWAKERGFRGLFPWALNYDAIGQDALIDWVGKGIAP